MPWSGGLNWKRQRTSNEFTGKVSRYRGSEIAVETALPKQSGTIPKEIIAECQDLSNSLSALFHSPRSPTLARATLFLRRPWDVGDARRAISGETQGGIPVLQHCPR
jgi:hypothetical protein